MTINYNTSREALVGAIERQGDILKTARVAEGNLSLAHLALRQLIELRSLRLYDSAQTAVPGLGRTILEKLGLITNVMEPATTTAENSLTVVQSTFGATSNQQSAKNAITHASIQIENIHAVRLHAGNVAEKMRELPGNASLDEIEDIGGSMAACGDNLGHIPSTAIAVHNNINAYLAIQHVELVSAPWGNGH